MGKRLLSLDDLYAYYERQGQNIHFSSSDDQTNIVVQAPGDIRFQKRDKDIEGLRPVVLQACHTLKNNNQSFISESSMKSALPSFSNRPILANIIDVDGQPEFNTHAFHVDENNEIVYDEIPIGTIPESCDAKLEYDADKDKTYCVVNGYIFEEYAPVAIEILEREEECPCSVELSVRELSYDSKNKVLNIDDFFFSGVTILGKTEDGEDVKPGMAGSNIKLADFSAENNSLFRAELIKDITYAVIERLSDDIGDSTPSKTKEGGNRVFNDLLEKYGKTIEDIKFNYDGMSDEELENAFKVAFDGEPEEETPSETSDQDAADAVAALINALPVTVTTTDEEQITAAREAYDALSDEQKALISAEVLALLTGAETSLGEAKAAAANQTAATTVETAIAALPDADAVTLDDADDITAAKQAYDSLTAAQKALVASASVTALEAVVDALNVARANQEDVPVKKRRNELTYTVDIDGEVKTFSVSLVDKLNALSNLVNSTYSEADDCWYEVDAFDEDKYVIMHDYWRNKHYRQSYSVKRDVYTLKGDRVEVFARYLTNDEITKLDNMKADYAVVTEKLAKYETEPEKVAILDSEDYANIANFAEFEELRKQENHFDLSVDEVREKADAMLLEYAKHNTVSFAENKSVGKKVLPKKDNKKSGRYGNLFRK